MIEFGLKSLTPRQLQILELMAEGLSNAEIGERLFIVEGTVKNNAKEIYEKLCVTGANCRILAAKYVWQQRIEDAKGGQ